MEDIMLIVHYLGLAMGLGTSFAFMFVGIAASKMDSEDGARFQRNAFALSTMGHVGLTLLIVSGLYLIIPFFGSLGEHPFLVAKLILVVVLATLIGMISGRARRAIRNNDSEKLRSVAGLGRFALLTGIAIVIMAVLQFH